MSDILMIQPNTSLTGSFVRMVPLSLLYAVSEIVKDGYQASILDIRLNPRTWQDDVTREIEAGARIVGFTVMSGASILDSLAMTRWIKRKWPNIFIVWGGPHPTFSPDDVLECTDIDFAVRGYGAKPFLELVRHLLGSSRAVPCKDISGLSWRDDKRLIISNQRSLEFEFINFRDIPYHLIPDYAVYRHIDDDETVFPMYSVLGCPYHCSFCSSPAFLEGYKRKWVPYDIPEILDHIAFVSEKFGATFIYFIDDDSFVNLRHVESIIDGLSERGINIKLGFRGARINEILRMTPEFIAKLVRAGTRTMHVGVESGSNRLLSLMGKGITVENILEANRMLAQHPELQVFYNFIIGYPTETLEETKQSRDLILRLISENPSCFVIPLNKPRPLPKTELMDMAVQLGYVSPKTLEEWGKYDVEAYDYNPAWLSPRHNAFIRMMFLSMYFLDNKILRLNASRSLTFRIIQLLSRLYRPIALLRFRLGLHQLLVEDWLYRLVNYLLPRHL